MIIIVFIILAVLLSLFVKKWQTIYFIPFLLQFNDIVKILFEGGPAARESIVLDFGTIIFSIVFSIIILVRNVKDIRKYTSGILLLVIYLLILIFSSSDIWYSFKRYLNVILPFFLFLASLAITKKKDDIKLVLRMTILMIVIFILNITISSILKLDVEYADYGVKFVYLGSVNFFIIYNFTFALILIPLAYFFLNKGFLKYLLIIFYFIGLLILILILKRTYVYLVIIGFLTFLMFLPKKKNLKYLLPILIIGLLTYFFADDYITRAFLSREDVITRKLSEEGRIMELALYPEIISKSPDPENTFIFGKEFLNTEGKFVIYEQIFNEKNRLFHTDLGIILYGAGILGLFLFIRVIYSIMRNFIKLKFKLNKFIQDDFVSKIGAAFISVYICLIASTFSDGITVANNRALAYMFLGSVLGYMLNEYKFLSANGNYINHYQ